jgi:hypothetical protein
MRSGETTVKATAVLQLVWPATVTQRQIRLISYIMMLFKLHNLYRFRDDVLLNTELWRSLKSVVFAVLKAVANNLSCRPRKKARTFSLERNLWTGIRLRNRSFDNCAENFGNTIQLIIHLVIALRNSHCGPIHDICRVQIIFSQEIVRHIRNFNFFTTVSPTSRTGRYPKLLDSSPLH